MSTTLTGKASVTINAIYRNGTTLYSEKRVPARTHVQSIPQTDAFREVTIRMVVDTRDAEDLFEGINSGDVELNIQGMISGVERHK